MKIKIEIFDIFYDFDCENKKDEKVILTLNQLIDKEISKRSNNKNKKELDNLSDKRRMEECNSIFLSILYKIISDYYDIEQLINNTNK